MSSRTIAPSSSTQRLQSAHAKAAVLAAILFVAVAGFVVLRLREGGTERPEQILKTSLRADQDSALQPSGKTASAAGAVFGGMPEAEDVAADELTRSLGATQALLVSEGASAAEISKAFEKLRAAVHAAPPNITAAALISELENGWDADTGLLFVVGEEGVLDSAPTWRTWLIDLLGQTDPASFENYSRLLVARMGSQDEFALALRNLTWVAGDDSGWSEVARNFETMVSQTQWLAEPSTGFLEAFDVAVAFGVESVPTLARFLDAPDKRSRDALARAAFVALDRLMLSDPDGFLRVLEGAPGLLQAAPEEKASLLSRLDPESLEQAAYVERWLTGSDAKTDSVRYFFEIFPNPNRFDGPRLVTASGESPATGPQAVQDDAAVALLQKWRQDPRQQNHRDAIEAAISRLSRQSD